MNEGYSICLNEWALDKDIKNELGLLLIISSLCAKKGYCFASNEYLAKIFQEDVSTISRKLKKLETKKYVEIVYKRRGCEIVAREIRLTKMSFDESQNCHSTIDKKIIRTNDENAKDNIISINNININKESKKERKTYDELLKDFSLSDKLTKTIMDFIQMRKFIKKPLTNRGLELMINKLQKMSSNEEEQIKILEQSIMNNWQGIFEIKKETKEEQSDDERYEEVRRKLEREGKLWFTKSLEKLLVS